MNKKRIIIISAIVIIGVIFGICICIIKASNQEKDGNAQIKTETLDISQVFELEDVQKSKYEIENIKDIKISSKYLTGTETYELKANVDFQDDIGKMYYVRESYRNLNIYQTQYKIDEYENISSQVEGIIENFETKCKSYLGIEESEKGREELSGESKSKATIPLGESIYYEEREYRKSYDVEDKQYDINFYKKDKAIVCELVLERE